MKRIRMEVFGKVQGVFYRASTREKARELGLRGWVRNREDGSVEAVAEGEEEALEALLEWAKEGPERARVEEVKAREEETEGEDLSEFQVRR